MAKGGGVTRTSSSSSPKGLATQKDRMLKVAKIALSSSDYYYESSIADGDKDSIWLNIGREDGKAPNVNEINQALKEDGLYVVEDTGVSPIGMIGVRIKQKAVTTPSQINFGSAPANYTGKTVLVGDREFRITATPTGFAEQQKTHGRFTVRYGEGSGDYKDIRWGSDYAFNRTRRQAWIEVKNFIKNFK